MPKIESKYDYRKVYRPNGTKYAEAGHPDWKIAVLMAKRRFLDEFGHEPRQEYEVVEIIGVTADYVASVYEIED